MTTEWQEPSITINGTPLSKGQAMLVRVALSGFDPDCGDDEHGRLMTAAYRARLSEVLALIIPSPPAVGE